MSVKEPNENQTPVQPDTQIEAANHEHPALNRTQPQELDVQTANQLLNNVFDACDMEPSHIPLDVLESWGNYKRPYYRFQQTVAFLMLIVVILLPMMFFRPTIVTNRTNVDSVSDAVYEIDIESLIPVQTVSATLDGVPVQVHQVTTHTYNTQITANGELTITAVLLNGQISTKTCKVNHIDTDEPVFVDSRTEDGKVILHVQDTFSGVDYENIEGVTVLSYDEENGEIICEVPDESVKLTIPDKAGNCLELLLSPVEE